MKTLLAHGFAIFYENPICSTVLNFFQAVACTRQAVYEVVVVNVSYQSYTCRNV
jgi:hypothetical protein